MQDQHVPGIGRYYWPAFAAATVFGSNTGDLLVNRFASWHIGGLHLPLLLALFAGILAAESFDRAPGRSWYWLAVIIAPILSNDLADLSFTFLGVRRIWVCAGLIVALVVTHLAFQSDVTRIIALRLQQRPHPTVPVTDATYWIALVVASTAGTLASDFLVIGRSLEPSTAALMLALPVAALGAVRRWTQLNRTWTYWSMVVALNALGNAAGQVLVGKHGVGLSQVLSVVVSGLVLSALLLLASTHDAGLQRAPR